MQAEIDNACFACGQENSIGLKLKITKENDHVAVTFTPQQLYQGYKNIIHGGIVATILDELMVWAAVHQGVKVVTAELNVRFKSPMLVGEQIRGVGRIISTHHTMLKAEAWLEKKNGSMIATASGKMLRSP